MWLYFVISLLLDSKFSIVQFQPAPTPLQDRTPISHDDDVGGFAKLIKTPQNPSVSLPSPMPTVHVSVKKSPLPPLPKSSGTTLLFLVF